MDGRIQRLIKATATFARGLVAPLKDELAKLTARVETLEAPETAAPGDERRQVDLEARLVSLERRVANHDARLDANRKHVEGLERKFGNMVHGK
jgi:capsule polysaccharide export protein KpsE/RkpR